MFAGIWIDLVRYGSADLSANFTSDISIIGFICLALFTQLNNLLAATRIESLSAMVDDFRFSWCLFVHDTVAVIVVITGIKMV